MSLLTSVEKIAARLIALEKRPAVTGLHVNDAGELIATMSDGERVRITNLDDRQ